MKYIDWNISKLIGRKFCNVIFLALEFTFHIKGEDYIDHSADH